MNNLRLLISPGERCELQSEDGEWRQAFLSVKGALDFVGSLEETTVTISDGGRAMRLLLFHKTPRTYRATLHRE